MTTALRNHLLALIGTALALCAPLAASAEEPEKRVTFYTTYGYFKEDRWIIPMRLWVHEQPDALRTAAANILKSQIAGRAGLSELTDEQDALFSSRAHSFIADSESREEVVFRFDGDASQTDYRLTASDDDNDTDRNGLIEGFITLGKELSDQLLIAQSSENGWLTVRAVSEDHGGTGRIRLVPEDGLSVVSDIDDTIKITEIPSGEAAILMNTFFRPFRPAPCMAVMYRGLGEETAFHYVSGGPWQMYETLVEFVNDPETGFPEGTFHMKNVRTNLLESESYQDLWKLVGGSQQATFDQKVGQISTLLRRFPNRQFVLIGDSGERDPEVFREVRNQHPQQIAEILIRDVSGDESSNPQRLRAMTIIQPEDTACSND